MQMQIQMTKILVRAKDFKVTDAMSARCFSGAEKLFKYDPAVKKASFVLSGSSKTGFEVKLKLGRAGQDLFFEQKDNSDLYTAIKEVCTKAKEDLSERK